MSRQYRGFLVSLLIHIIFVCLICVSFDTSSSMNRPLLIDLTFLGAGNESSGPKGSTDGGFGLKKDTGPRPVHTERTLTPTQIPESRKPVLKTKTVQKTQDAARDAKAHAPQLQPAVEPEGLVPIASPHPDPSGPSDAPPLQDAISGGKVLADTGLGGVGDSVQGAGPGAGGGEGSRNAFLNKYLEENFAYVKDIIQKNIIYPERARLMGWQGKVVVSFVILENGSASSIMIKESSGKKLLDDNVIRTVKALSPFPKPPVKSELLVPIVYRLEGT